MRVIYADVLVIINIYITYILLTSSELVLRKKARRTGKVTASVLSGFYSLIILVPRISDFAVGASKLMFSAVLIAMAFRKGNIRDFFRAYAVFFAVNFVFAGFMLAVWLFAAPEGMYFSNSIVYFDVDAGLLIVLTVVCYALLSIGNRFISHRVPSDTVYDCRIYIGEKAYSCHCFLDTGNSLHDCYTGEPVIVVTKSVFSSLVGENPLECGMKMRLMPCSTVSGEGLLYAFSCDKAEITGLSSSHTLTGVTVALTENRIMQGRYEAILPCDIFENTANEREKIYAEKNKRKNQTYDCSNKGHRE